MYWHYKLNEMTYQYDVFCGDNYYTSYWSKEEAERYCDWRNNE
jgi:hypothetical protein